MAQRPITGSHASARINVVTRLMMAISTRELGAYGRRLIWEVQLLEIATAVIIIATVAIVASAYLASR